MQWLFFNRVFPPAKGATGDLLAELCEELNALGCATTIVTAGNEQNALVKQSERLIVHTVTGLPFTRSSHWRRALSYLSLYPAFLWRALRLPRHQVIVTLTDPPLHLLLGPFVRFFKGGKLVHWAQDIYPEVAEELGVLPRHGLIANLLRYASNWALHRHDVVVTVGRCMRQRLIERGIAPEKIVVISNWAQKPSGLESFDFKAEHKLADKFVVMYAGNFGLAHSFEPIVEAVIRLELLCPDIEFVFVGDGPRLPWLREQLAAQNNVRFLPYQPKDKLANCLASADVHLVSMGEGLCGLVVPSKVYGVLAAGRPCVFLGPQQSEASQIIQENQCGWQLATSSISGLIDLILKLRNEPDYTREFGKRADESQLQNTAQKAAVKFVDAIERLC